MPEIENKLKEIMSLVFEVPTTEITDDTNPDDLDNWDSIGTINLITALEDEFDIEFEEEEILEMLNFQLIKINIEEKLEA
ncbi:phosphopantetheine-binding protein [Autumnicola psychrophila]|uniref:Phosphopantetheine-binding protein n=1 Tax=Autumnicola psychrophila TaxID=3075592 RepID=A0ABU3DP07_9FLAO|nr:phosphopantetheine-binding protein [Zunongwangia sp. F225]MDT0685259.1 phosphopantetheine-binding protein [Zunongwangia sp. F225]